MKLSEAKTLAELEKFLTEFKNWNGEEHVYDFGAVVALWLSLLDNMCRFALDAELTDIGDRMDDDQRRFLKRLATLADAAAEEDT